MSVNSRREFCFTCGNSPPVHERTSYCRRCHEIASTLRSACHYKVSRAVLSGALPKAKNLKCVDCGAPARDYDHRDYTKPLSIEPVCRSCNQLRGPGSIGAFA